MKSKSRLKFLVSAVHGASSSVSNMKSMFIHVRHNTCDVLCMVSEGRYQQQCGLNERDSGARQTSSLFGGRSRTDTHAHEAWCMSKVRATFQTAVMVSCLIDAIATGVFFAAH